MNIRIFFFSLFLWIGLCPIARAQYSHYTDRTFQPEDKIYDEAIKTVLLYPDYQDNKAIFLPPVISISQEVPLKLEFDRIDDYMQRYSVQIVNCNADWTVSQLNAIEYLEDYNEFYINDRELSFNTKVKYVHYRFVLPRVKISGNYIVKVYEEGNEDNLVLTRRFMVYDNAVSIGLGMGNVTGGEVAFRNQQIDFTVGYNSLQILNPMEQVKVVLRQNYRWDNAITDLRPTSVRDYEKRLEYNFFNFENNFKGGNEFRMFDARSFQFRNLGVDSMVLKPTRNEVFLIHDISRNGRVYNRQFTDMNGLYYVQNMHGRDPNTEADYMDVTFTLKVPEAKGNVYVQGAFSNWRLDEPFRMKYNPAKQAYQTTLLLKQGYYNYNYTYTQGRGAGVTKDDSHFEGSHNQTENEYEILVYYRPFGARSDLLIGYKVL